MFQTTTARLLGMTWRVGTAASAAALIVVIGTQGSANASSSCGGGAYNWWAAATAPTGAGTSDGSYITEYMPDSGTYHVGSNGTVDEADWVSNKDWSIDNQEGNFSENGGDEVGWIMGVWPYASSYTYYYNPHPYYTVYDGFMGTLMSSNDLPENSDVVRFKNQSDDTTCPIFQAYDLTAGTELAYANPCANSLVVLTPRYNESQGEIASGVFQNDEGGWMGGNFGSGLDSKGYYEALSNHTYYAWGSGFSTCSDSPYWISSVSNNEWENGGTG